MNLTQKRETREAVELIETNLLRELAQGSNWCASANLRLLRQLKKTIEPLLKTTK